jgi:SIR2-like protein
LFSAGDKVRLVTTNFDTHFSTTAAELYDDKIETFYAPALPLGDQFSRLVYLHGSAEKDPKRCVLTDEDFGSAYLTQAWASRFLAAMFSEYVVLFVGYSHNDTVMNYLARGLPPVKQRARFAFSTSDEESLAKWEFLGIHPMIYEKSHEENAHKAITVSVGEWVSELNRGLLEKAQRIRSVVETQPPLEGEDADYIKYSLGEKSTWQLFFKYARKPEWISWLETQGFSKRIFDWYGSTTGLAALVRRPHQLDGNRRPGTAHDRPSIATTGVDCPIAQGVDGRFDGDNDFRFVETADREPGGELISKTRAERGLVPCISQSRSFDLSVLRPVKEDNAWIRAMVVCKDRSHRVQIVHNGGIDSACFHEIGAGNRPVRFVWHSVSRRQFVKGPAFLLGSDVALNRKGQPDFGRRNSLKIRLEGLTGGGKILAGQVHLQVDRP